MAPTPGSRSPTPSRSGGDLEAPAPYVVLTAAEGGDDEGEEADAQETATNGEGGAMTERRVRTIASDDNSKLAIAWFGVVLVAFGITAHMRARSAVK